MTVFPFADLQFVPLPGREAANPFRDAAAPVTPNVSVPVVRLTADASRSPHQQKHPHPAEAMFVAKRTGRRWAEGVLVCFFPHPDLAANIDECSGLL